MKFTNNGKIEVKVMPNHNDVLNLSYHEWQDILTQIIEKTEYAKRLQKAWIGWATLEIYNKLNRNNK